MEIGILLTSAINNDIPVAPPSIKRFGNKKLFKPKAAEKIPQVIKKKSLIVDVTDKRNIRNAFARS